MKGRGVGVGVGSYVWVCFVGGFGGVVRLTWATGCLFAGGIGRWESGCVMMCVRLEAMIGLIWVHKDGDLSGAFGCVGVGRGLLGFGGGSLGGGVLGSTTDLTFYQFAQLDSHLLQPRTV